MELTKEILQNLRQDYKRATLTEKDTAQNPIAQFEKWFTDALNAQLYEPNVMTLATVDKAGHPDARIMLLKGFDENGFTFFTNYLSEKGKELKKNPFACVVFFWPELERQVRISGKIDKLDKESSEQYFNARPRGSQIGAIVSPQSQAIENREILEKKVEELDTAYGSRPIPKPAHWGGYLLKPTAIEFWQGRPNRLHDRIKYELNATKWTKKRLAP